MGVELLPDIGQHHPQLPRVLLDQCAVAETTDLGLDIVATSFALSRHNSDCTATFGASASPRSCSTTHPREGSAIPLGLFSLASTEHERWSGRVPARKCPPFLLYHLKSHRTEKPEPFGKRLVFLVPLLILRRVAIDPATNFPHYEKNQNEHNQFADEISDVPCVHERTM